MEKIKVFVLGVLVYISINQFFRVGAIWFNELENRKDFEERAKLLKTNFWKSFSTVIFVIGATVILLIKYKSMTIDSNQYLRLSAIILALTASLGRGGWNIQSHKGKTIIERIDRAMFVLSQLGATIILLLALTLK